MEKEEQDVLTAMIQINGLSPWPLFKFRPEHSVYECLDSKYKKTAALFFPGAPGHEYREQEVLRDWRNRAIGTYLLFAGRNEEPSLTKEYVMKLAQEPDYRYGKTVFFAQKARHTPDQTEWALDVIQKQIPITVNHIVVCTAAYHVPRAFLTLLRSIEKRGLERELVLSVWPVYNRADPAIDFTGFVHTGGTGIAGEVERILKFQQPPYEQVASIPSYIAYLKWRLSLLAEVKG